MSGHRDSKDTGILLVEDGVVGEVLSWMVFVKLFRTYMVRPGGHTLAVGRHSARSG